MSEPTEDSDHVMAALRRGSPVFWANPGRRSGAAAFAGQALGRSDIEDAAERLGRFAPALAELFPKLAQSHGVIESALCPVPKLAEALAAETETTLPGDVFVKADHALPVAGSIKARGGIYAVLHFAEQLAVAAGLLSVSDDYRRLLQDDARALFAEHELTVASTGNLGLSIGLMGAALGFRVTVHMSVEAKPWKKARLRARGVNVVEHGGDYTAACTAARAEAEQDAKVYFIDDENSEELFLGYSVAALRLEAQLRDARLRVDAEHPLLLYLPCGVGGAPGGITFGARHVFGDHAHCFSAEPVAAPCMLLGLLTGRHDACSVYDIGLDVRTDADGLAVSRPSRFVGKLVAPLLSGCYTVTDAQLYRALLMLHETEGIAVEPSAAAGCMGPGMVSHSAAGKRYLEKAGLAGRLDKATHVIWTTGGSLVPTEEQARFLELARGFGARRC